MCFSAQASFTAAATLSVISLLSIKKARTNGTLPLAITPLFFAIQQAAEGIVWITLATHTSSWYHYASIYSFLFFAFMWWPVWIPISLHMLEKNIFRKKLLFATFIIGLLTSIYFLLNIISYTPYAEVLSHHINYPTTSLPLGQATTITEYIQMIVYEMYLTATIFPLFFSSIPYMWILGIVIIIAFITTNILYATTVASTWCFFAALCSIINYFIIQHYKKSSNY